MGNSVSPERRITQKGYFTRLCQSVVGVGLGLSLIEKTLLLALLLMLGVSALDAFQGRGVGNQEAIRLAKTAAQQDLMAQTLVKNMARQ